MKKNAVEKRNWKVAVVLLVSIMLLACLTGCQGTGTELSDKFDEEMVKSEAMKSIEYFNERDYQAILDMGAQELKDAITLEEMQKQCDPYLEKRGEFKEIEKTVVMGSKDKKTGAEYGGTVMIGVYEAGKIQFTIGFDEEMKLVQFMIK